MHKCRICRFHFFVSFGQISHSSNIIHLGICLLLIFQCRIINDIGLLALPIQFPAKIFTLEAIALTFFGTSWLIKGEILGLLSDD